MYQKLLISILAFVAIHAKAQIPPPVDIPIPNIPQQTEVWCWVAVAQQIIHATHGPSQTPAQCALVAEANGANPASCCAQFNPSCVTTGSIAQIQMLIHRFGGRSSSYAPPTDPMTLYQTIAGGRAVIVQLRTGQSSAHVVVVRGMSFSTGPQGVVPILHLNDPLGRFTQPVPYSQIAPIWMSAIVVN